ncbi:phage major capsid protein [Salinarimonas chemoclinalis]|uniref:phage major capsid protein n=1 Tax=Salinarimonas chemoclinalis TaxID=3241599 RepID=UPI0035574A30
MSLVRKAVGRLEKAGGDERQIRIVVSTSTPDRDGDVIDPHGLDLEHFKANPVVLWQHDPHQPIARAKHIYAVGNRVEATVTFPPVGASQRADEVLALVKAGIVNAASIGFRAIERKPRAGEGGWHFTRAELWEFSLVSVPANPEALIIERAASRHPSSPIGASAPAIPEAAPMNDLSREALAKAGLALLAAKAIDADLRDDLGSTSPGVLAIVEKAYPADVVKTVKAIGDALAARKSTHALSDFASGGALSLPDFASTLIAGLENRTVIRQMQPQIYNVAGSLIMPREASAPAGSWLGENDRPTPGAFEFGDTRLDPRRLAVEIVVSRSLVRQSTSGMSAVRNLEQVLMSRLVDRLRVNEDVGYLRGGGTAYVPLGLRSQVAPGHVTAITGTSSTHIEADLSRATVALRNANIPVTRETGFWIMAYRTREHLANLRDANGNKVFPSIEINGTLKGHLILDTNQVPSNLGGGGNEAEILFFHGPSIVIAQGGDAEARISTEATYIDANGNARSCFQHNEMLFHVEMAGDVRLERAAAGSVITGVTY